MTKASRSRGITIGSRIGGCVTVLRPIDKGGRDPLYEVWHHEAWCPMALKLFAGTSRFEREAAMLGALAHPNIVRALGVVGSRGLLMEYLEGPTLKNLIASNKHGWIGTSDAVRAAIHLGAALAHMHVRGILHLDLKPRNVIVSRGRPVIIDLGAARARHEWDDSHLEGTDAYMAPEQCRRAPVSPATDVFGLGATLYEMLTGRPPFQQHARGENFAQLRRRPMPIRRHRRSVSRGLEALVDACMDPTETGRPALAQLLPELHRHIHSGAAMWPPGLTVGSAVRRRAGSIACPHFGPTHGNGQCASLRSAAARRGSHARATLRGVADGVNERGRTM